MKGKENINLAKLKEKREVALEHAKAAELKAKAAWGMVLIKKTEGLKGLSILSEYLDDPLFDNVKLELEGLNSNDSKASRVAIIIRKHYKGEINFTQANMLMNEVGCPILENIEQKHTKDNNTIETYYYQELAAVEAVGEDSGCFSFCTIS